MARQPETLMQSLEEILGRFEVFDGSQSINQDHLRKAIAHATERVGEIGREVEGVFLKKEKDLLAVCHSFAQSGLRQEQQLRELGALRESVEAAAAATGEAVEALQRRKVQGEARKEAQRFLLVFDKWQKSTAEFLTTAEKLRDSCDFRAASIQVVKAKHKNLGLWTRELEKIVAENKNLKAEISIEDFSGFLGDFQKQAGTLLGEIFRGFCVANPDTQISADVRSFKDLAQICSHAGIQDQLADQLATLFSENFAKKKDLEAVLESVRQDQTAKPTKVGRILSVILGDALEKAEEEPRSVAGTDLLEIQHILLTKILVHAKNLLEELESGSSLESIESAASYDSQIRRVLQNFGSTKSEPRIQVATTQVQAVLEDLKAAVTSAAFSKTLKALDDTFSTLETATSDPKGDLNLKQALAKVQKAGEPEFVGAVTTQLTSLAQSPSLSDPSLSKTNLLTIFGLIKRLETFLFTVCPRVTPEEADFAREWSGELIRAFQAWLPQTLGALVIPAVAQKTGDIQAVLTILEKRVDELLSDRKNSGKLPKKAELKKQEGLFSSLKSKLSMGLPKAT